MSAILPSPLKLRTLLRLSYVFFVTPALVGWNTHAVASQTENAQTYDFHRHYKAGEVERHKAVLTVTTNSGRSDGQESTVKYTMVVRKTVKSMSPDGAMVVVVEYEQAFGTVGSQVMDITSRMPRVTEARDSNGNVKVTTEGGGDAMSAVMVDLMATVASTESLGLPAKPVKVGETWALTAPVRGPGRTDWTGTAGLMSVDSKGGADIGKINYKVDASEGNVVPAQTHSDASLYLDTVTGKTAQFDCRITKTTGLVKSVVDIEYTCLDIVPEAASALKRDYKAGDTDRFMLYMVTTTPAAQVGEKDQVVRYEFIINEIVKSVEPDGTVTLTDEFERSRYCLNDADITDITAQMPKVTITRSAAGSGFRVSAEGGEARHSKATLSAITQAIRMQNNVIPPKAVTVGNSWKFTGSDGGAETAGAVSVEAKDTTKGVKTFKVKCVTDTPASGTDPKRHGETISIIDIKTGKTLQLTSHATLTTDAANVTEDFTLTAMDRAEAGGK